jgi:tetratricopeptide (TPR) repeat protein
MLPATERREQTKSAAEQALLADALLGAGLPALAEQYLYQAALAYQDDAVAEDYLRNAEALAPDHAAVLIGLYRFYFYKGRLACALEIAKRCLAKAARENDLAADWRDVSAGDAVFGRYDDILPRFFLFSLKGYAYLQMRLGNLEEGRAATLKLLQLDPSDKIGAKVLLGVLDRIGQDDD